MGWAASDVGRNAIDLLDDASARGGQEARNTLQLQLLEHRELDDAAAALAALRARPDVDSRRVSLVGHSFGGSLTLLLAEREPDRRAIVLFSTAKQHGVDVIVLDCHQANDAAVHNRGYN